MAKGNPFLGQLRGKVGDVVFARVGGVQTSRAHNAQPRNPRTPAQMFQRGCLATVSEMYIRGTRNFFKYAFSNKTAAQSEFNKFCQLNIGRVPCNARAALKAGAPAIGNFIMTQGTLAECVVEKAQDAFIIRVNAWGASWESTTVGDISKSLISTYGYADGDIITVADLHCPATPYTTVGAMIANAALTSIAGRTDWNLKQFRIDSHSTALAADLGIFAETSEDGVLVIKTEYAINASKVEGVTVVCSRNVKSGVLVSNSTMHCNTATQNAIDIAMSSEWKEAVSRYWVADSQSDIAPTNILQGSLLPEEDFNDDPTFVGITAVKYNGSAFNNGATMVVGQNLEILGRELDTVDIKVKRGNTVVEPTSVTASKITYALNTVGSYVVLYEAIEQYNFTLAERQMDLTVSNIKVGGVNVSKGGSVDFESGDTKTVQMSVGADVTTQMITSTSSNGTLSGAVISGGVYTATLKVVGRGSVAVNGSTLFGYDVAEEELPPPED